jgi:Trypsin-like peptidase domain
VLRYLCCVLILVTTSTNADASCVDPSTLVRSTVNLTRIYDKEETRPGTGVLGIRGTGWFLSERLVVTAAHVSEAMHLSEQDWKEVEIKERVSKESTGVRVLRVLGSQSERVAVLELKSPFAGATVLSKRVEPLVPEEPLVSLAYPNDTLRFAGGRFVQYGENGRLAGLALLEMYDGKDRLVLDHGASGAPVLDCDGKVVAVVSTLLTKTMNSVSGVIRVSTAWQTPNVASVPIEVLKDFSPSE